MESLGDALNKRMQQRGLGGALGATQIVEGANRVLPQPFRAKTFKNGVLTVIAPSSTEAYFFKQEVDTYCERINAALSKPVVTELRIRINH